jgi:hypothetical protein
MQGQIPILDFFAISWASRNLFPSNGPEKAKIETPGRCRFLETVFF